LKTRNQGVKNTDPKINLIRKGRKKKNKSRLGKANHGGGRVVKRRKVEMKNAHGEGAIRNVDSFIYTGEGTRQESKDVSHRAEERRIRPSKAYRRNEEKRGQPMGSSKVPEEGK